MRTHHVTVLFQDLTASDTVTSKLSPSPWQVPVLMCKQVAGPQLWAWPCGSSLPCYTTTWHGHAVGPIHQAWTHGTSLCLGMFMWHVTVLGQSHVAGPQAWPGSRSPSLDMDTWQVLVLKNDYSYTAGPCPVTDIWNVSVYRHGHMAGHCPQAWPCRMSLLSLGRAICYIPIIWYGHVTFLCPQTWPHKKSPCPHHQAWPCSISPPPASNVPIGILATSLLPVLILLRGQK